MQFFCFSYYNIWGISFHFGARTRLCFEVLSYVFTFRFLFDVIRHVFYEFPYIYSMPLLLISVTTFVHGSIFPSNDETSDF